VNWICLDFKDRRVSPSRYTLKCAGFGPDGPYPVCWRVEGSLDGVNWSEMHSGAAGEELAREMPRRFEVSQRVESRYVRIVNVGRNRTDTNQLVLAAFELFGRLQE